MGGPAKKAGILVDDVIVKMNGKVIEDPGEFLAAIHHKMPKDAITLTVLREGNEIELKVVLEAGQPRQPQRIAAIGFSTAS
ncbi:MAG TPA: hypothetical protein DCM05_05950 [Elusimicrobia bacterium]|nr:hypothetical protein [Elusimicrobiota bacterium]